MIWWLTIGFAVVWVIAVVIEIIWFSGTPEEPKTPPGSGFEEAKARADDVAMSEEAEPETTSQDSCAMPVAKAGG